MLLPLLRLAPLSMVQMRQRKQVMVYFVLLERPSCGFEATTVPTVGAFAEVCACVDTIPSCLGLRSTHQRLQNLQSFHCIQDHQIYDRVITCLQVSSPW